MQKKTIEEILNESGSLFYKCSGISMRPFIKEGRDYICIRKHKDKNDLHKYDVVLFKKVFQNNTSYILHRIVKINEDNTYFIMGDNCIGGDTVKYDDILGVLTEIKRNNKLISLNRIKYKIYVICWCKPWKLRTKLLKLKNLIKRGIRKILRILHIKK